MVAGLLAGLIHGVHGIELDPDLVLFVILPPLLWSAGRINDEVLRSVLRGLDLEEATLDRD